MSNSAVMKKELVKGKTIYYLEKSDFEYKGNKFRCTGVGKVNGRWFYDIKNLITGENFTGIPESKLIERLNRETVKEQK